MSDERRQALTARARAGAALWRTALGAVLSVLLYIVLLALFLLLVRVLLAAETHAGLFDRTDAPVFALLFLFSFGFMAAGPVLLARPLHLRSAWDYVGPPRAALDDFLAVFRALALLTAVLWLLLPSDIALRPGLPFATWAALLPLTALAILVQTGCEELVFRGYLQGQLAARFRSPLVWMLIPSALFASLHHAPAADGDNAAMSVLAAFAFGLAAADLTARTGTLGAAIALHLVNNLLSLAVVALPGQFSGLALWLYPFDAADDALRPLVALDLAVIGVSWLAARVALRR